MQKRKWLEKSFFAAAFGIMVITFALPVYSVQAATKTAHSLKSSAGAAHAKKKTTVKKASVKKKTVKKKVAVASAKVKPAKAKKVISKKKTHLPKKVTSPTVTPAPTEPDTTILNESSVKTASMAVQNNAKPKIKKQVGRKPTVKKTAVTKAKTKVKRVSKVKKTKSTAPAATQLNTNSGNVAQDSTLTNPSADSTVQLTDAATPLANGTDPTITTVTTSGNLDPEASEGIFGAIEKMFSDIGAALKKAF